MIVYHNQRCSKSREVLALLEKNKKDYEVREYLKDPLTKKEIKDLLNLLNCEVSDLVRTNEPLYKEKFGGKQFTETQLVKILSEHPILLQRPILKEGNKAVIGRPIEHVSQFLKELKKKS